MRTLKLKERFCCQRRNEERGDEKQFMSDEVYLIQMLDSESQELINSVCVSFSNKRLQRAYFVFPIIITKLPNVLFRAAVMEYDYVSRDTVRLPVQKENELVPLKCSNYHQYVLSRIKYHSVRHCFKTRVTHEQSGKSKSIQPKYKHAILFILCRFISNSSVPVRMLFQ